jgi:hypothetical protein
MSRGRPLKNTNKLIEKYGPRIMAIYNHGDRWEIRCWYAGVRVNTEGRTLPEALQELDRIVRGAG